MWKLALHFRSRSGPSGVVLDTVAEMSGCRGDRHGIWEEPERGERICDGCWLDPGPLSIIGLRAIAHEMVEEFRIRGTMWPIAKRKSGRMVSSVPSISLALWLMIIVTLITLGVKSPSTRSNRHFYILIYFTTFGSCALFIFLLGLGFSGEGKIGSNQCFAGAYIRSGGGTRSLEDQLHKSHLGIGEEGL